jgi:hypothetical protein
LIDEDDKRRDDTRRRQQEEDRRLCDLELDRRRASRDEDQKDHDQKQAARATELADKRNAMAEEESLQIKHMAAAAERQRDQELASDRMDIATKRQRGSVSIGMMTTDILKLCAPRGTRNTREIIETGRASTIERH